MDAHLGKASGINSSCQGSFDPLDLPAIILPEHISLYIGWRLKAKYRGEGEATECSRLDFDYGYWQLKAGECVSSSRVKTTEYYGNLYRGSIENIEGVQFCIVASNRISDSDTSKKTPGAIRNVYAPIGNESPLILAVGKASAINAYFNRLNNLPKNREEVGSSTGSGDCNSIGKTQYYFQYIVGSFVFPTQPFQPPRLPNQPTKVKPMDCCKKVDEIYKYLGIAKLKKEKFKVAKAFLVPGGTGTEDCEDYYQLNQALFRMLANGLIINPVSKPLGSEWKSVNATAWAGQVYEMAAEAMSNGDSSQKYEISMMMQITQLLSIIAEQTRKIEFLSEVLGVEPGLDTEEIPACFTIYEGHKGFDKTQPKRIDTAKAKTDDEVEAILGKMLRPSKIPITKWVFKPESKSIVRLLRDE